MANIANMNIGIGADIKPLQSGLDKAQKQITTFSEGVESRLNSISTGKLRAGLSGIGTDAVPAANKLASSLDKARPKISNTTSAVTNLNRVVQDAPFGIIGVANNIEPLIQSFNSLKAQTGSTTGALKQLITSAFTGPGALITVTSLASTALLVFGDRIFGVGQSAKKAEKDVKSFNEVLQQVAETEIGSVFDDLSNAEQLEALESALEAFDPAESASNRLSVNWDKIQKSVLASQKRTANMTKGMETFLNNTEGASQALGMVTEEQLENIKQNVRINGLIKEELERMIAQARATKLVREQIQQLGIEQQKTNAFSEEFLKLSEQARQTVENTPPLGDVVGADIEIPDVDMDLGEKIFPPGSLGALQERLNILKQRLQFATDPDVVARLQSQIQQTENSIDSFGESAEKSLGGAQALASGLGNALSRAVVQGNSLGSIFSSIGRQLASGAIITALKFLLPGGPAIGEAGFFSQLFGGIFHDGGVVPGPLGKERLVLAQGGETIRTPQQERNIGGMGRNITINGTLTASGRDLRLVLDETNYVVNR